MIDLIVTILKKLATICWHVFKERLGNMLIGREDTPWCFLLPLSLHSLSPSPDERGYNVMNCHKKIILWIPAYSGGAIVGREQGTVKVNGLSGSYPKWEEPPPLQGQHS